MQVSPLWSCGKLCSQEDESRQQSWVCLLSDSFKEKILWCWAWCHQEQRLGTAGREGLGLGIWLGRGILMLSEEHHGLKPPLWGIEGERPFWGVVQRWEDIRHLLEVPFSLGR